MEALKAIAERCSYRGMFEKTPVPREDLVKILEAGYAAPSGCNKQTTSFIGLDDADTLRSVVSLMNSEWMNSAPAAICVLTRKIPGNGGMLFNVQDYAAAVENMLLAVTALGYASCWIEGYITGGDKINRQMAGVLGVPPEYELVAFLPVGIPAEKKSRAVKEPFDERVWFNGFGK